MLIIIGFPMMEKGVNMDIKQEVLSRGGELMDTEMFYTFHVVWHSYEGD